MNFQKRRITMKNFSEILSGYVRERKTNISALASETGIDRTLLHKYISGKRTPSDIQAVLLISDGLMLSYDEETALCESYRILSMGEEGYERYLLTKKILDYLSNIPNPEIFRNKSTSDPLVSSAVSDRLSVEMTIRRIISDSSCEKIFVISPPSCSLICSELISACIDRPEINITQILSFCSISANHNLKILEQILPLLVFCPGYTPVINYCTVSERENSSALLPNLLLTERYAFSFSNNCDMGILHTRNDILKLYHTAFSQIAEKSYGLIEKKISSAPYPADDIMEYNENMYINQTDKRVSLIFRTGSFWSSIMIYEQSVRKCFEKLMLSGG